MFLKLHDLTVHLRSDAPIINEHWRRLFTGWPLLSPSAEAPDISLQLSLSDSLPPLPKWPPFFTDDLDILSVYRGDGDVVKLHFLDGALVDVPLYDETSAKILPEVCGVLTPNALGHGRFEDITYTSLAPLLRRLGYFLIHAFGAAKNGRAVLIVGPSGCGKTTTGLSLLLSGWELLANDVLILEERQGEILALPTPSAIGIRRQTLDLLPSLKGLVGEVSAKNQTDITGPLLNFVPWSKPSRVTAIYFPKIEDKAESQLLPQNKAICLAGLMAESIDQWDEAMLPTHMTLLQKLSQQAKPFSLHLGQDVDRLPALLSVE